MAASAEFPKTSVSHSPTLADVEAFLFCDGNTTMNIDDANRREKRKKTVPELQRIGFRAWSVKEILNDGYRWRKYGKKAIKNSRNPRNYYRCAAMGCMVKKKVQRDCEDPNYVITIYDGTHNHETPEARS